MIILVACLTALAIWLVPDKPAPEVELPPLATVTTDTQPSTTQPDATPAVAADRQAAAASAATQAAQTTAMAADTAQTPAVAASDAAIEPPLITTMPTAPGVAARRFIATRPAPDAVAAMAEAERQQQAGHPLDAYLLTFYAARLGDDQAALMLAHQADPAFGQTDAGPLTAPNIPQALRWYDQAAAAGNPAAIADRQQLRSRIEQAAAEGDEDARRLTLQWQ